MNSVGVTLLARDGDPACRYGFGFAFEVERDDFAPVDGSDARDGLGHDDLAPRRNALEPRRGVHNITDCGEVADLAVSDDSDVRRPDVQADTHLEPRTLGRVATLRAQNGASVTDHRVDVPSVAGERRKVETHHFVTDEFVNDPVLDDHLRELGVEAIEAFGHLVRSQCLGEGGRVADIGEEHPDSQGHATLGRRLEAHLAPPRILARRALVHPSHQPAADAPERVATGLTPWGGRQLREKPNPAPNLGVAEKFEELRPLLSVGLRTLGAWGCPILRHTSFSHRIPIGDTTSDQLRQALMLSTTARSNRWHRTVVKLSGANSRMGADRYGGEVAGIESATRLRTRSGHMKLADCPVFPDEAATALSTDRGVGWRMAREVGPVLRHPEADWVFVVGRDEVLANLDDARFDRPRAVPESDLEVHQRLFAPKSAHDIAAEFRSTVAALIDRFAAAGGGDSVAAVTTPMASALFEIVVRWQLLPFDHLSGRSGHVFYEACCNLFKHASWHLYELARRPELCDMLRRQPELIRGFVEEVLRLEPMVPICQRFTTQPTTVGGVELPANAVVMLCIGAVQRDGSDAMSTDDLVIGGRAHRHWSLGAGSMRCQGGHIVRQVLRVLVEEWVDRAGHVGLVPGFRPAVEFPATQSVLWLPELPLVTRA